VAVVEEEVIAFTAVDQELVTSLASQAAVALENTRLLADIRNLFDSFVKASVVTIEKRDPVSAGHSDRVAELTVGIAEQVDRAPAGVFKDLHFTRDQIQAIRYASLLHDFGKVVVSEKVLVKGKKLYVDEVLLIRQRFDYIKRTQEAQYLRSKVDQLQRGLGTPELFAEMDARYRAEQEEIDKVLATVMKANEPSILEDDSVRLLMDLPNRSFPGLDGSPLPLLTPNEVEALSIRRGSLSLKERLEIERHVSETYDFLAKLPWTAEFAAVPDIAHAHHEKLDGSGYPRRLTAREIPVQSKMMTIADIYDALVAWDRPYKASVPPEKALAILEDEVRHGKVDGDLLSLFIEAKIFHRTAPLAGARAEVAR
jgi:HD-GYP domain-containing protein (c-di-GMP phosphodiesterase class II)